jgi:hypothetical protein
MPDVGLKSTDAAIPCKTNVPDFAWVQIRNSLGIVQDYYPALFTLDGKLYTQAIKFPLGTYWIQEFVLYDDVDGVVGIAGSDVVVFGTPHVGGQYAEFVATPLEFSFTVEAFKKAQIEIEVLCFQDHLYTEFGFIWFHITEIVVREQCFFGDICFKHYNDYAGSDYAKQPGGLKIDMPAIMMLKVYKNGSLLPPPYDVFTNDVAPNWGEGAPLCIVYPDNLSIAGEVFTVELYIMVKQGVNFPFVLFHTFTFTDAQMIPAGTDGVVDIVLGSCNLTAPDLLLPPWQNLPVSACLEIAYPGTKTYWDVRFTSYTPAGSYDLPAMLTTPPYYTDWMGGWCGDKGTTINQGAFCGNIYSSLINAGWPVGMPFNLQQIAMVNWLMNHLSDYGINIYNHDFGADGGDVQQAIWKLLNNITPTSTLAATMASDASSHGNFIPLPGGWAAVLIVKDNNPDLYQLIFVVVDP